ncbi:MAG: CoA-binding protein [Actinomycetota bacterium]|nr:CoA-binding protein [Actinomycetota bacterium]
MPTDEELSAIYTSAKTIAVVGISADPSKDAHTVPEYLQYYGYKIVPVNPKGGEILGEKVYGSLDDVDIPVDVVDVFRPAEEAPGIARSAIKIGAKVLWMQPGIISDEAAEIAIEAGLTVVMDTCIRTNHRRLGFGE